MLKVLFQVLIKDGQVIKQESMGGTRLLQDKLS